MEIVILTEAALPQMVINEAIELFESELLYAGVSPADAFLARCNGIQDGISMEAFEYARSAAAAHLEFFVNDLDIDFGVVHGGFAH